MSDNSDSEQMSDIGENESASGGSSRLSGNDSDRGDVGENESASGGSSRLSENDSDRGDVGETEMSVDDHPEEMRDLYDNNIDFPHRFARLAEMLSEQKVIVKAIKFRDHEKIKDIYPILEAEGSMCQEFEVYVKSVTNNLKTIREYVKDIQAILKDKIDKGFADSFGVGGRPLTEEEKAELAKAQAEAQAACAKLALAQKDLSMLELAALAAVKEAEDAKWEAGRAQREMEENRRKAEERARKEKEQEERKRQEEEEKERMREEAERRKREEAERLAREEEERRIKEEEERERREREERERIEAERKRRQQEEEERRRQEEAERKRRQQEEEERRRQEEEERKRRQQEEEKRRRQEEEERIRLEAEEKERQIRLEEERIRKDVNNWHPFIYSVEPGEMGVSLGCVLRAMEGTMESQDSLTVERIDQLDINFQPTQREELVSNIISLRKTDPDEDINVEEPIAVALPHCAPSGEINKETAIKMQNPNGDWQTVTTSEVSFSNIKEYKFVEVRLSTVNTTLLVVTQPKREKHQVSKKGGKFTSSVDRRVSYTIKPGMYKKSETIEMEVNPVDSKVTYLMQKKYPDAAKYIQSSSPFVSFDPPSEVLHKPVTFNVPIPPNTQKRQQRPTTAAPRSAWSDTSSATLRPRSASCVQSSSNKHDNDRDSLRLLYKDAKRGWMIAPDVDVIPSKSKDIVMFDMAHIAPEKFVLVRTAPHRSESEIEKAVELLEDSLGQKMVQIVVGQKKQDPSDIVAQCVNIGKAERLIHSLEENGYETSSLTSDHLPMREGQELVIRFKGNVGDENQSETRYNFNSHFKAEQQFVAKAKDLYAQKMSDRYHGHLQFLSRDQYENKEEMLCDFLLNLPKPHPDELKPHVKRKEVTLRNSDILDNELLKELASEIGDEWRDLALNLEVTQERLQAIKRSKENRADAVYDMLITWVKATSRSTDKVQVLCDALHTCGRDDLEKELLEKHNSFQIEKNNKIRESRMKQAFVKIAQQTQVINNWQKFAKALGLSDRDLHEVENSYSSLREKCLQSLNRWSELQDDLHLSELDYVLRGSGYKQAADLLNLM